MLKPVVRTILEMGDRDRGRCTVMLKCGHPSRRNRPVGRQWVQVHCAMCTYLSKERETKSERRALKSERREERKRKQQFKVERQMAKKKMASAKVVKKSKLVKKAKGTKMKVGRKWFKPSFVFAEKGSLLQKLLTAFSEAEGQTIGENELISLMEKAGVKAIGTKTVKKQVKAALRNMFRAGVVVKDRDRKNHPELSKKKGKDADEDEEETDDEEETTDDAAAEEEKPKSKKKVIKKKR